jgi:transposase-like protein
MPKQQRYHCNNCNTSFSVTTRTIFHKTHIDLQKWFLAISLVLNAKKGMSARQLGRDLEVNRNTAWFMGMRIRKAMFDNRELLQGIVEIDDTYVGGKPRKGSGEIRKRGRGTPKQPVIGMVERNGNIKAQPMNELTYKKISRFVRGNINMKEAVLISDQFRAYSPFGNIMPHEVIDHSFEYAHGDIHTNNIESFWALLKRGIVGQYHKVSKRHLGKYIVEFCYRHNNRKVENVFELTLAKAVGV